MSIDYTINETKILELKSRFRGEIVQPEDDEYDQSRQVWNGMIDKYPSVIAYCTGVSDVIQCVKFAREQELPIAVRGGGHHIAGNSVCDSGIVTDLSNMNSVTVNPKEKTAHVEAGATLADVDHETQAFELATPLGINSTTGIAGLTLGGGFGWLSRKYGMTVDNLLSADIITAKGELVKASEDENSDLFWGIRGGSGNFGIVTNFKFQLHEVGPEILCGPIIHPHKNRKEVIQYVRDFNQNTPEECVVWIVMRKAPPLPFLPDDVHGNKVIFLVTFYAGEISEGKEALSSLRNYGDPIADAVGVNPYVSFQQSFDPLLEPGARNYWKTHNFAELSDEAIDIAVKYAGDLPTELSEIFFGQIGGATERVDSDAMAYPHRDAKYVMNVHTRWEDPSMDEECIEWARGFFEKMKPHAIGGAYVNFISEEEGNESLAYGPNYERLAKLKAKYDPENFFHINQNITPQT